MGQGARGHAQVGGRAAHQGGYGVFILGAADGGGLILRLNAEHLGLRGDQIGLGDRAGVILILRDPLGFPIGLDRALEQSALRILAAQVEIGDGELRLGGQLGVGQRRGVGLHGRLIAFDLPANFAPDVQRPAHRALRIGIAGGDGAAGGGQRRALAAALTAPGRRDAGQQARLRFAHQRPGLLIGGERGGDGLIVDFNLRDQPVELGVAINRPPAALVERIARLGGFPALRLGPPGFLEFPGNRSFGALVIGADRAGGQSQQPRQNGGLARDSLAIPVVSGHAPAVPLYVSAPSGPRQLP